MSIAFGILSRSCSVWLGWQGIPASVRTLLRVSSAALVSRSSSPTNAATPESCDVPAVFPAASTTISPIWDGTLSHPADFSIASRARRSANDSGSPNTEKPKFCPANSFSAAMIFSWSSGAMVLGSLSFSSSSCACEATGHSPRRRGPRQQRPETPAPLARGARIPRSLSPRRLRPARRLS